MSCRDLGEGEPYSSTVELVNGEIDADVAEYLAQSEQTPSGLSLGTFVQSDGVKAAGGLLIQVLPQAAQDPLLITLLESRLADVAGFTTPIAHSLPSLQSMFETLFGDLGLQMFPEQQDLSFRCRCSSDSRFASLNPPRQRRTDRYVKGGRRCRNRL